jgi:hypothetical protein
MNANPNCEITRNHKTKEKAVAEFLKKSFPHLKWICDKKISNTATSRRRPDICVDLGWFVLVVEVDENQHLVYDNSDENKRLQDLQNDIKGKKLMFFRFNPDQYISEEDTKIGSCWRKDKEGVCRIVSTKQDEWNKRLDRLRQKIDFVSKMSEDKHCKYMFHETTIDVTELFFDGDVVV